VTWDGHKLDPVNRRVEQGEATRRELVAVARRLFAERGYDGTSVEAVLEETGVSRGALYHHFPSKQALFEAVLVAVEADVMSTVTAAARASTDPVQSLRAGCAAWLRLARDPEVQRIELIDAPAVVGWQRWRELAEGSALGQLKTSLQRVAETGRLPASSVDMLGHMLLAALNEVALLVARAEEPDAAVDGGQAAVDELLERLLREPA
jgi:AcrR family transcriptional regulator